MQTITITLSDQQAAALKQRTGKRTVLAAVKTVLASPGTPTVESMPQYLHESEREERAGKLKSFKTTGALMKWLDA